MVADAGLTHVYGYWQRILKTANIISICASTSQTNVRKQFTSIIIVTRTMLRNSTENQWEERPLFFKATNPEPC